MATASTLHTRERARSVHHAVVVDGQRTAIPFTFPGPAYALAKRILRGDDIHPSRFAKSVEVYEHGGKYFDVHGEEVPMRERSPGARS